MAGLPVRWKRSIHAVAAGSHALAGGFFMEVEVLTLPLASLTCEGATLLPSSPPCPPAELIVDGGGTALPMLKQQDPEDFKV